MENYSKNELFPFCQDGNAEVKNIIILTMVVQQSHG